MTAERFSPIVDDDTDGPSRLRNLIAVLFVLLFTVFLFEAMDGVQRAAEEAERRENVLRAVCGDATWDVDIDPDEAVAPEREADHDSARVAAATTDAATTDPAVGQPPATGPVGVPVTAPVTPAGYAPDGGAVSR